MGTEAVWIPLVMAAVAGGATYANNRQQAKKADNITSQQLLRSGERQKKADSKVAELIDTTAKSDAKDEKGSIMAGYMQQLQAARGGAQNGLQTPAASSRFAQEATAAALGIDAGGKDYAETTSRLDAPILQRQGEALARRDTGVDIGTILREQEGDDAGVALKMRTIRDNPWLLALSQAASSYGKNYTGGAGAGSTAAPKMSAGWGTGTGGTVGWA